MMKKLLLFFWGEGGDEIVHHCYERDLCLNRNFSFFSWYSCCLCPLFPLTQKNLPTTALLAAPVGHARISSLGFTYKFAEK